MTSDLPPLQPSSDKKLLRRQLQAERQSLIDRHQRAMHLQEVLRVWLVARPGPGHRRLLADQGRVRRPAGAVPLGRGRPAAPHRPAGDRQADQAAWASTSGTRAARWRKTPTASPSPRTRRPSSPRCCWCPASATARRACGWAMAAASTTARWPRWSRGPFTAGLAYAHGFVPWLQAEPHDVPLDAVLTDEGLAWQAQRPEGD